MFRVSDCQALIQKDKYNKKISIIKQEHARQSAEHTDSIEDLRKQLENVKNDADREMEVVQFIHGEEINDLNQKIFTLNQQIFNMKSRIDQLKVAAAPSQNHEKIFEYMRMWQKMINKLEICGLTKHFGEKKLFEDLNLTLAEPAVLWAPSGWGKTTLLRILMGLEAPDSGTVQGVGRVGAVFQEDRLCPQLTAVQNVELVLPEGKTQYKTQIVSDFQRFGYDKQALAPPARKLSGGQKRRAALLRALWAGCDTLLLDEPFTGMDPETMKKAAALLKERRGERAVLLATHDREAIRELGWKVIDLT